MQPGQEHGAAQRIASLTWRIMGTVSNKIGQADQTAELRHWLPDRLTRLRLQGSLPSQIYY